MINEPKLARNGDIVLTFNEDIVFDDAGNIVIEEAHPFHLMVMGRLELNDRRVFLHSSPAGAGEANISGVRASQVHGDYKKPAILIFRIKDPALLNNFNKVVEAYAKRVSDQKDALRPGPNNDQLMPTPFANKRKTNQNENALIEEWGLYRNIRAYQRYKSVDDLGRPEPMSKNKGVKCSQFVAYSYMIALLMTIFPNGLPENITNFFKKIEEIRRNNGEENIDQLMKEFHEIVKAELSGIGQEKYLPLLCFHVKSTNIDQVCANQLGFARDAERGSDSSKLFDVEPVGFLFEKKQGNETSYLVKKASEFSYARLQNVNRTDEQGNTALSRAVKSRNIEEVVELLRGVADVNVINRAGESLIDILEDPKYSPDHETRVKVYMLILPGLVFNLRPQMKKLSELLFVYAEKDDRLFNEFLLKCNVQNNVINYKNIYGQNLLHVVIARADVKKAAMLIKLEIDIDAQMRDGNTALMLILITGSSRGNHAIKIEDVTVLVQECFARNPDFQLMNSNGETVESLLKELYPDDIELARMFREQVEKNNAQSQSQKHDGGSLVAERLRLEKAYNDLLVQINKRQAFENNNQGPPYSDHPTTLAYFDAQGYTLLQYAAALGDMKKVRECIARGADVNSISVRWMGSPEESPIAMALRNGHVEVAEYLFNQGANCVGVHPEICQDQTARKWLERKIKQALAEEGSKQLFQNNPPSIQELCMRAAEIGDVNFIHENVEKIKTADRQDMLNQLLIVAARNGKQALVYYLLGNGATINQEQSYVTNALNEAAKHGHVAVVDLLIQAGADLLRVDERKCNVLMRAIDYGSPEIVLKILKNKIDLTAVDINGDNILHYCARCNDPKIIQMIAEIPGIQALLNVRNIYGQSPGDIAANKKNDNFIKALNSRQDMTETKALVVYGHEAPVIDQHLLVTRWQYYLNAQYRDKSMFLFAEKGGGFAYLHEYYAARGMEEYFFQTLSMISKWDGSQEALDAPFSDGVEQKKYYNNLGELFEQWINDVLYLQHSGLTEVVPETRQSDREDHMVLVGNSEDYAHVSLYKSPISPVMGKTSAQADEFLLYFSRMPVNTRFEIRSHNHATSWHVGDQNQLVHYDPNCAYQTARMRESSALTMRVIDYQYIGTNCLHDKNGLMVFNIEMFCFAREHNSLRQYHVLSENEFPRSTSDADIFWQRSPNRFTHLHIAVMTRCTLDLARILQDGFSDFGAKDVYGHTAIQVAQANHFDQGVMMISYAMPAPLKAEQLIKFVKEKATPFVENLMNSPGIFLIKYININYQTTPLRELIQMNSEYCPLMLSKMENINITDELGNTPLFYAVMYQKLDLVVVLLERGADVNVMGENAKSIVNLLEEMYGFEPEKRVQVYLLILPKLKFETESLRGTLSAMLFGSVEAKDTAFTDALLEKSDVGVLNMAHANGFNVLHKAILQRDLPLAIRLLAKGVNINAQTDGGNTPLMMVLILGSARVKEPRYSAEEVHELVRQCLSRNPDLLIENKKGETAASLIRELYPHDAHLAMMLNCQATKAKDANAPKPSPDSPAKPKKK